MNEIKKGDRIKVKAQGIIVEGTVSSVEYNGKCDGWYIEMIDANVPGGYSYWKQGIDGGNVIEINGKEIK